MAEEIKNNDCTCEECKIPECAESAENAESTECATEDTKALKAELESLKTRLADAEKKAESAAAEAADKYTRLAAEYDNFRRRSKTEREGVYSEAVADTIMGIVPIIDNLMYADKFGGGDENPEKYAEGVRLILGKLPEVLEKMNVTVFGEVGETFDPTLHNAVMHVEDDSLGEGEITDVLQCGYKYGEKVIRYAMVKVAN